MFYYQAVLNRQTGCFATIWLVATKGKKVNKREYLKVNVPKTCDDLMDYILVRVPPPQSGLPRPRLSLYLSSLLQYGVIKVYHHQCELLHKDIQDVIKRLEKYQDRAKIDLGHTPGGDLRLPDVLALLEDNEWAEDPMFGQMTGADISFLSPSTLGRMEGQFHSSWSSTTSSPEALDTHTALPEDITMKETPPVFMPPITEFEGADLPDDDIIDILLAAPEDAFGFGEEAEAGREPDRTVQPSSPTAPPSPPLSPSPTAPPTPPLTAPPTAPLSTPPTAPRRSPRVTRPRVPPAPEEREEGQESSEDVPTPPQRKRKRWPIKRKLVVDTVTQITDQAFKDQISNMFANTAEPEMAGPVRADPNRLFAMPCDVLPLDLMPLWESVAVIPSHAELQALGGESSSESSASDKVPSGDEIPLQSDGDMSDGREQPSPTRQISTVGSPGRSSLEPIPEEDMEVGPVSEADPGMEMEGEGPDRGAEFMRILHEQGEASVTFRSMLGDGLPGRRKVASTFMTLLEGVTAHTLCAEQEEAYADIWISVGPACQQE